MRNFVVVGAFLGIGLGACSKEQPAAAAVAAQPQQAAAVSQGSQVTGTVAETINAGGYTYIKMTTDAGEQWAAVPQAEVKQGERVTIVKAMMMPQFASPTLNRTFDRIWFGQLGDAAAAAPAPAAAEPPSQGAAHGRAAPSSVTLEKPVAKAAGQGARTVAELHAQKAALDGKPVALRGQVTKATNGVMGKNWLHLQDGSGDAAAGTHDVTVTTSASVSVGDIVLARGTLRANKNVGSGYSYAVLIEDAAVEK